MAATIPITTRSYFRALVILHFALIAGQVAFGLTVYVVKLTARVQPAPLAQEVHSLLRYVVSGLALSGIVVSWLIFSSRIKALKELSSPAAQYKGYRSACIIRYALLEGPSLFSLTVFLLSYDYFFLAVPAFIVLVFMVIRPTKKALLQHLQPADDQRMLMEDPDAVLYEDRLPGN